MTTNSRVSLSVSQRRGAGYRTLFGARVYPLSAHSARFRSSVGHAVQKEATSIESTLWTPRTINLNEQINKWLEDISKSLDTLTLGRCYLSAWGLRRVFCFLKSSFNALFLSLSTACFDWNIFYCVILQSILIPYESMPAVLLFNYIWDWTFIWLLPGVVWITYKVVGRIWTASFESGRWSLIKDKGCCLLYFFQTRMAVVD